ncbi:MAG TPA: hypothetical protein PKK82_01035 [Anaerolineaceae bacterium]|nr:hypothetical protein [Anaerolineaceae bacterium]
MKRDRITVAIILILAGVALLARQHLPNLEFLFVWPYWGFLVAGLLLILAWIQRNGGLAVLAALLTGACANILLQKQFGGLVWLSMLAFLGVGMMLSSWIDRSKKGEWRSGLTLVIISAAVFLLAGGSKILPWPMVRAYWPAGLIALGLILLISNLSRQSKD